MGLLMNIYIVLLIGGGALSKYINRSDDFDVMRECVKGSETGKRIESAERVCYKENDAIEDRDHECSDYENPMDWIIETHEYCVLNKLGWIMSHDNITSGLNETKVYEDINGLPENVTKALLERMENQECDDEDMVAMRSEDPCWSERHSSYSDDENEKIEKLWEMLFHVNCFMYVFHDTCLDEVLGSVDVQDIFEGEDWSDHHGHGDWGNYHDEEHGEENGEMDP